MAVVEKVLERIDELRKRARERIEEIRKRIRERIEELRPPRGGRPGPALGGFIGRPPKEKRPRRKLGRVL